MQVVEFNISLKQAKLVTEIVADRKLLDSGILKQTSTNTYEIEMVDEETEETYAELFEELNNHSIEFFTQTLQR